MGLLKEHREEWRMETRIAKVDEKARVCISQSAVKEYGDLFIIVKGLKEIILFPVPKDPVKEMRALGRKAWLVQVFARKT